MEEKRKKKIDRACAREREGKDDDGDRRDRLINFWNELQRNIIYYNMSICVWSIIVMSYTSSHDPLSIPRLYYNIITRVRGTYCERKRNLWKMCVLIVWRDRRREVIISNYAIETSSPVNSSSAAVAVAAWLEVVNHEIKHRTYPLSIGEPPPHSIRRHPLSDELDFYKAWFL